MKKPLKMPEEAQPRNITRADLVLAEGFGLEVDGRMKTVFPTLAAAQKRARGHGDQMRTGLKRRQNELTGMSDDRRWHICRESPSGTRASGSHCSGSRSPSHPSCSRLSGARLSPRQALRAWRSMLALRLGSASRLTPTNFGTPAGSPSLTRLTIRGAPSLSWPSQHPAHGAVHGAVTGPIQRLLA